MKRHDQVTVKMIAAICVLMLCQAGAQTNDAFPANPIEQTETESIEIRVGDSFEHVLEMLGEPRIECPLNGGKCVLIYEVGEVCFQDNKVSSFSLLTAEQLAEKRERQRLNQQRTAAEEIPVKPLGNQDTTALAEREDQLRIQASKLRHEISISRNMANRYMSSSISCYNMMVGYDGKNGVRLKKDLLACLPNNTIEEFYTLDLNFDYFERRYRHISSARLNLESLRREYAMFVEEYERLLASEAALSAILKELDELKIKRGRLVNP